MQNSLKKFLFQLLIQMKTIGFFTLYCMVYKNLFNILSDLRYLYQDKAEVIL